MAAIRPAAMTAILSAAVAVVLLAGCGASPQSQPPGTASTGSAGTGSSAPRSSSTPESTSQASPATSPSALPVAPGAGALPQTRALPSTHSEVFRNAMTDLWLAVTKGNSRFGLPAFFPLAAYKQVKAIADPAADWRARLWQAFVLDVGAAHRLVGGGARLVRVIVPVSGAAWIPPGACFNSTGYWHVPGARIVYRKHGQERSFGIASLISWRGVWYVVHFGAVLRGAMTGVVDQPAAGPGTPGPPGGC